MTCWYISRQAYKTGGLCTRLRPDFDQSPITNHHQWHLHHYHQSPITNHQSPFTISDICITITTYYCSVVLVSTGEVPLWKWHSCHSGNLTSFQPISMSAFFNLPGVNKKPFACPVLSQNPHNYVALISLHHQSSPCSGRLVIQSHHLPSALS